MPAEFITSVPEERLDLNALVHILWRKRMWIVLTMLVLTAITTTLAFVMTPIYKSSVILAPANSGGMSDSIGSKLFALGGLASAAGIDLGGGSGEADVAIAVLKSRQFAEKFINDRNLAPLFFAEKWDAATKTWKGGAENAPTAARSFRYFSSKVLTVAQDKRTGFVTMDIEWRDRNQSAGWANELAQRLNEEMRQRAITEADASIGYLEQELARTTTLAARDAISRLIESQVKRRMYATVSQEYVFRVIDKAMPADADSPARPKKLWLIVFGVLGGFALGVILVLFSSWLSPPADGGRHAVS